MSVADNCGLNDPLQIRKRSFEATARALSAIQKSSEPLLLQRASRGVILKLPAYVDAPPESKSRSNKVLE